MQAAMDESPHQSRGYNIFPLGLTKLGKDRVSSTRPNEVMVILVAPISRRTSFNASFPKRDSGAGRRGMTTFGASSQELTDHKLL